MPWYNCKSVLSEVLSIFDGYLGIYTDRSDDTEVAAAAVNGNKTVFWRQPYDASIFSAEAQAILLALDIDDSMKDNDSC